MNNPDFNDMSDKEINDLYNSFETDETKDNLNKRYKEHENYEEPTNESIEDIKNSEPEKQQKEVPEEFLRAFKEEATKESKEKSEKTEQMLKKSQKDDKLMEQSIYYHPDLKNFERIYIPTAKALYCELDPENERDIFGVYLRIERAVGKFKYSFSKAYNDLSEKKGELLSEETFTSISGNVENKKAPTTYDEKIMRQLGRQAIGKFTFKDHIPYIQADLNTLQNYEQITSEFDVYEKVTTTLTGEEINEEEEKTYMVVSDYPEEIQKEAKKIVEKGKLWENLLYTISITHEGDTLLKEQLLLVLGSIFAGSPVHTEMGGDSGQGKSDLIYAAMENYPQRYIQKLRKFSSKYIYYAKDEFDKDYNILYFDDIDYTKDDNIESVKVFTDNKEKEKVLKTVMKKGNLNTAVEFKLSSKFLGILSYAKSATDEELSDRLFKGFIDTKKDDEKVKNTIKKNVLTNIQNNLLLKRLNLINQCCIQYIIEQDFNIFNPYSLLFNPVDFNNRDVTSFFNLVDSVTFYHKTQRRTVFYKGKKIVIGTYEDFKYVYDRWNNDIQKYKLNDRQEKVLNLLPSFESEEKFLEYVGKIRKEYEYKESFKSQTLFKNELTTISYLSKKLGVAAKTLKTDIDSSQEKGNKKNLMELGLIFRDTLEKEQYKSPYIYGKILNTNSNSKNNIDIMDISKIYPYFNILEVKRSLIIYLLNGYNILISSKRDKEIKLFCSEYHEQIKDYGTLCSFLESFMGSIQEWGDIQPSSEDIKKHFDILNVATSSLLSCISNKNISIQKIPKRTLNNKQNSKQRIDSNNIHHIHNEIIGKSNSIDFDLKDVNNNNNCNVSNDDINELIQNHLESNPKGLTYKKIVEIIFEYFDLSPDSEENDHIVLKIEKVLDDLIKSNIIFKNYDGFNQVYILK